MVLVALVAGQVVDEVAEGGDLLGDTVVDLARQPATLLDGRDRADVTEQNGRLEPEGVVVETGLDVLEDVLGDHLRAVDDDRSDGPRADDKGEAHPVPVPCGAVGLRLLHGALQSHRQGHDRVVARGDDRAVTALGGDDHRGTGLVAEQQCRTTAECVHAVGEHVLRHDVDVEQGRREARG